MQEPSFRRVFGKESRKLMLEGINEMADVVGSTMGAKGRNVIYESPFWKNKTLVVNDGVTIAREFNFKDPVKNMGMQLVKHAAIRTNDIAGDGTTGATVIARAIVRDGWDAVAEGINPVLLRKEIDEAHKKVNDFLIQNSVKITKQEQAEQVATIAMQDSNYGKMVGETMWKIGAEGAVSIQNGMKHGVEIDRAEGMRIKAGISGGVLTNPGRLEARYEGTRVLLLQDSVDDHEFESKWLAFIRQAVKMENKGNDENGKPIIQVGKVIVPVLLIVAERLSTRIIQFMNDSYNMSLIKWIWIKPPSFGDKQKEIMKDIASLTGAKIVDKEQGVYLDRFSIEDLGTATGIVADGKTCTLTVDKSNVDNKFLDRCNELKSLIENADTEDEQKELRERYAALTGGVATIKVAMATEQDTNELKLRIEDAVNATRSAMEEGIVTGGGVALFDASKELKEKAGGETVLKRACEAPIKQILHNAGYEPARIEKTLKTLMLGEGINVMTDQIEDMQKIGIIDPLKVIRTALMNAVSVAGLLLTSEFGLAIEEDKIGKLEEIFNKK